jgi:hypothetical protein
MDCTSPITLKRSNDLCNELVVPCGKCLACRIAYRRMWSTRLYHEVGYHDDSSFVTLTYSDSHLPVNCSLRLTDLQLFFKRLRVNIKRHPDPRLRNTRIKYYACGEYGDLTLRPHYHMILFGLGFRDGHRELIQQSWPLCDWSVDSIRNESIKPVTPESINYVCGYIDKKLSGQDLELVYTSSGRENVFKICSQGLGERYAIEHRNYIESQGCCSIRGRKSTIPRYYVNKLGLDRDAIKAKTYDNQCEQMHDAVGVEITRDELFGSLDSHMINAVYKYDIEHNRQRNRNLIAKHSLRNRKL